MRFHPSIAILFVSLGAACASGCSGGSSGGGGGPIPTPPSASPSPILVAGSVRHFTGTDSTSHVYASPGPTTQNFTSSYAFTEISSVQNASAGAPGAFDIHAVTSDTTQQAPLTGNAPLSSTTDTYENQSVSGSSVVITETGVQSVTAADNVTADATGGGPYTLTTTGTTTYNNARTFGTYPLVAGTSYMQPIARVVTTNSTLANSSGAAPSTTTFTTSQTQTFNADGSYTRSSQLSNGESEVASQTSNGLAALSETGPVFAEQENIGAPGNSGGGTTIPVSITRQTPSQPAPVSNNYGATDWYPGGGAPALPFDVITVTVKGPVSSLPSGCSGAISEPNLVEVDQTETSLNLFGSITSTQQQRFDSNGVGACTLRTVTTTSYNIQTGALTETAIEQYAMILQSIGTSSVLRNGK